MEFGVNQVFLIACACLLLTLVYYVIPKKEQWLVLFLFSLTFYCVISKKMAVFIFISTLISYVVSIYNGYANEKIDIAEDKKVINKYSLSKKIFTFLAILIELSILFVFKYYNFFMEKTNFFNGTLQALSLIAPLGISFYTFQTLGYCIDVYRDKYKPQKNFLKYCLFSTFFLQIFQGPIGRYDDLSVQLYGEHKADYKRIMFGLQRIGWGFFKKLVIADRAAILVNNVFTNYFEYSGLQLIIAIFLYAIVIYTDFSGFMDMVLGMGEVLDIKLSENFNVPYFSKTIPEFWRRWHITLNTWFRDYLFYPLLRSGVLSKVGSLSYLLSTSIALIIVWITTGLWHGASNNYILWGAYFAILMVLSVVFTPLLDKLTKKLKVNKDKFSYKFFQLIRTFILVCIGYILFATNDFEQFMGILKGISNFRLSGLVDGSLFVMGLDGKDTFVLVTSILVLFGIDICKYKGIDIRERIAEQGIIFRWIIYYMLIFSFIIFGIYGPEYDASKFIYMGF